MRVWKTILTGATALSLMQPLYARDLVDAFYNCEHIRENMLAADLIATIPDPDARAKFPAKYASEIKDYRFVANEPADRGYSSVTFVKPIKIAGLPAKKLKATTCLSGCGLITYELEFGRVAKEEVLRLREWVEKSGVNNRLKKEDSTSTGLSVYYGKDGELKLECDMSN